VLSLVNATPVALSSLVAAVVLHAAVAATLAAVVAVAVVVDSPAVEC
jgi:hypothetical protein